MGGDVFGGIDLHGSKFEQIEVGFVDAHPFLFKQNRTLGIQLNDDY